jgi:hypothetical protein
LKTPRPNSIATPGSDYGDWPDLGFSQNLFPERRSIKKNRSIVELNSGTVCAKLHCEPIRIGNLKSVVAYRKGGTPLIPEAVTFILENVAVLKRSCNILS